MECVLFRYFPFIRWEQVIVCTEKQMIRGDVRIDDGVHNLEGADGLKILFDSPHNRSFDAESAGMVRASDWEQVCRIVDEYAEGAERG